MTKTVLVEYVIKADASVAEVEREIGKFVAGIGGLGVGIRYASHRRKEPARGYAHFATIPSDAAQEALQSADFFKGFSAYLRTVCEVPPRVTWLEVVAATG